MGAFDEFLGGDDDVGPSVFDKYKTPVQTPAPTLQERVGFDPDVQRLGLLPYPKGALKGQEGPADWTDWVAPEALVGAVEAAALPGHVYQGGQYTGEDALNLAGSFVAPLGANVKRGAVTKSRFMKDAPTENQLKIRENGLWDDVRKSDITASNDDYSDFILGLDDTLYNEGYSPDLHKKIKKTIKSITKYQNDTLDPKKLQVIRELIKDAAASKVSKERRLVSLVLEKSFDDFVEKSTPEAFVEKWKAARRSTFLHRRTQTIQDVIDKAHNSASGFENGLRNGFRSILNSDTSMRLNKFTPDEVRLMESIVQGTSGGKIIRFLGKFGLGANRGLGSWLGGMAGNVAGGPVGAGVALAAGTASNLASGMNTAKAAEMLRALSSSGGKSPAIRGMISPAAKPFMAMPMVNGLLGPTNEAAAQKRSQDEEINRRIQSGNLI